jgi:Uma2 family endonuclease
MTTGTRSLILEKFLQLPETKPASEFINGNIAQKPMPQGEHSLIQTTLCETLNGIIKPQKIAMAFPELRCVFGGSAIVPDISIFRWERIPRISSGRIANRFEIHPDWAIEILSPDQSQNLVLEKLLHCSEQGTELCWLIDPKADSILIILANQQIKILRGDTPLPILQEIEITLSAEQIFSWLTL